MISDHTAAGQLAGYLFQPERALFHLATSPAGAVVGIETLDDVAVVMPDGRRIHEQDKHSVSQRSNVLSEHRVGLWKTFGIWLSAVAGEEIDLSATELQLVTNQAAPRGFCQQLLTTPRKPPTLQQLVSSLRKAGSGVPKSVRPIAKEVLQRNDRELSAMLEKVRIVDKSQGSFGEELKRKIAAALPLPTGHEIEIIQSLLGWVHDTAIELIREGQPAWLTKEAFAERYLSLVTRFYDRRFLNETAEALVPVAPEKRLQHRHRLFIRQLLWLGIAENDEQLLDSIDDFVRSSSERIRLAKKGMATLQDFRDFEQRLVARWKNIFRNNAGSVDNSEDSLQRCGKSILFATLDHREPLAGYVTQEWYLTRGSYHRLADRPSEKPRVGWHPSFEKLCSKYCQEQK